MEDKNVEWLCEEHAPKVDKGLIEMAMRDPGWFVGKSVKFRFEQGTHVEHMWVRILHYRDGLFHGILQNEPVVLWGLRHGDRVSVEFGDIEAVLDE